MSTTRKIRPASSLIIRFGGWFEASATGWGIVAAPLVFVIALVAAYVFSQA